MKKETKVKLYELDKLKDDFKEIDKYTNFISKTLKELISDKTLNKEDLKECINLADKINAYANGMINEDKYDNVRTNLMDLFNEYEDYEINKLMKTTRRKREVGIKNERIFKL